MKNRIIWIKTRIAWQLDRSNIFCWASLVSWFMGYSWNEIKKPSGSACIKDSIENGVCYCGKFAQGKHFTKQTKQEQERLRSLNL